MTDFYVQFFKTESSQEFAVLKLAISTENKELLEIYKKTIQTHNKNMIVDPYPNSGFDLFVPETTIFSDGFKTKMIDFKLKAEMLYYKDEIQQNAAFFLYPRSSLSKTPLMLANHMGIIDTGYRGSLMGAFRCFTENYTVEKDTKLLQICHPSLCKIFVAIVEEGELSSTTRGEGGFGSTGV